MSTGTTRSCQPKEELGKYSRWINILSTAIAHSLSFASCCSLVFIVRVIVQELPGAYVCLDLTGSGSLGYHRICSPLQECTQDTSPLVRRRVSLLVTGSFDDKVDEKMGNPWHPHRQERRMTAPCGKCCDVSFRRLKVCQGDSTQCWRTGETNIEQRIEYVCPRMALISPPRIFIMNFRIYGVVGNRVVVCRVFSRLKNCPRETSDQTLWSSCGHRRTF